MDIRCDLRNDVDNICRSRLVKAGYSVSQNHKFGVLKQYLNVLRREIPVWPRQVKVHPHLICPEELKLGFYSLISSLASGQNVNIYLSSNLSIADFQDGFLNDYGLHHFHLGSKIEDSGKSKGFVQRTGPVVLAYVTDKIAYLIDIKKHGKQGDPYIWTDQDVIERLHCEWPESIANFKLKRDMLTFGPKPTQQEKKTLRRRKVNTPIVMADGTAYMMLGGGITAANTSTRLQVDSDRLRMESSNALSHLCSVIKKRQTQLEYPVKLRLVTFDSSYFFHCDRNNVSYHIEMNKERVITRSFVWGGFPEYFPSHFKFNLITTSIF
ncbi:hypothetical protein WOB94_11135 [Vibrio parahaemolyticus]